MRDQGEAESPIGWPLSETPLHVGNEVSIEIARLGAMPMAAPSGQEETVSHGDGSIAMSVPFSRRRLLA
jgi:hypothetical protein